MSPEVRGECPTSQRHFVSIQDWVLEYTNTLWESDASPDLLELLNPQPERIHRPRNLLFCGPPSVVSQFGETMHQYDFDPFYDVTRAWLSPLTWAFFDKLCTRHMYTRNSPHIPYLPQHQFPFQEVVQRGSYALDFFLGHSWLITMRKALINAFNVYHLWLKAFQFFCLELDQIPVMEHGTHSDVAKALIESGQDGSLPGNMEQSFAKITAYRKIVRIEDTLAEVRAIMQLLMHRTLDHIALVAGLELPCFGVDHNLVGAFISMDDPNVPMAELEQHGVPLHGIRILEPREVCTLDPHAGDLSSKSQAVANGVAECGPDEAHGEFMEIWRMKRGAQVKHPSLWMIRPIQQKEDYVHQRDVYTAVFESDLRDVDSAMAGALVHVLGPSSISLCDMVPLPPRPPSPPPSPSRPDDMDIEPAVDAPITSAVDAPLTSAVDAPITSAVDAPLTSAVDAPVTSAVDAPITSAVDAPITSAVDAPITSAIDASVTSAVDAPALTTDPIHYFGFEGEEGYSSEEPSDDDFVKKCQHQSVKDWHLKEAQRDPHWAAVTTDFPMAFLGIPGPRECILSIIQEAQKKHRVYHSGLEHYVLERWSSAPPGPPGYPKCAKKCHRSVNADQGPRVPSMRLSMDPLEAGHSLVLPSGEKSTLSLSTTMLSTTVLSTTVLSTTVLSATVLSATVLSATVLSATVLSATVLSATVLSATVLSATMLSETVLSETVLSAIALLPHSSLVLLMFSIPPTLMQGHLFDIHSPLLVPHVFPTQVLTVLWVLLAVVHGLVIIAHTLLAIVCHLSITHILMNVAFQGLHHDWPEPENAMLEDQAPEAQTDSPIIPLSEFDDLDIRTDDNGQPGTEMNLDPPVFVGDWFCIEFSGITGDVNIREVFEHLSEDHLFSVHVQKNKGGKGLACLKKKVMLAFKSQPRWDAVLSCFWNSPGSRLFDFEEATEIAVAHQESIASFRWVLDPDYVEMCYAHQQSADDLTLMLENAPTCREIGDLCMLHLFPPLLEGDSGIWTFIRYHFLDLHRFPPLVADEVKYLQRTLD
ncbi:hypothetical protein BS47DRAFT_1368535 [Hydnum rufescens UP504]|uniref:Uncharacterized protein n=1 Tax=Hydnum rufescens UP504 TaxID=1448309 RepID=A0A9P6AGI2_9AGAM|nr:hypothetical protein BS47DRAFT_1368535 [Hydnum rufescens UP504]